MKLTLKNIQQQKTFLALLGNKNYTTMKKYINLYALAAMAMFIGTACTDELEKPFEPIEIIAGEEIVFSASTAKQKSTRTIYGETNNNNNNDLIELNWAPGDYIHIASQDAAGLQVAEYQITMKSIATGNNSYNGDNTADGLVRVGSAGLQWSDADVYDFYAVYPSMTQLQGVIPSDVEGCGLTKEGVFTGYLPVSQTFDPSSPGNDGYVHEFKPNMSYAYMTAKTNWTRPKDHKIDDASEMINLNFSSLTTGLKVTLVPGQIGNTNSEDEIEVFALSIFSESGKDICGKFEYNIANETFKLIKDNSGTHSQITMNLPSGGSKLSSENGSITATFFLLPVDITPGDLMLRVYYYRNGTPQFMTARLGIDIPVKKLTYINKLKMKSLADEVAGSKWFAALNPDVYVSQISIPMAANTFANTSYGFSTSGEDVYRTQQTKKIEDLWDMGVRGFEMVNQCNGTSANSLLGKMVASEKEYTDGNNFLDYLKVLRARQVASFEYNNKNEMVSGEPLVLLCTYQAVNDGYIPATYVQQLFNSLKGLIGSYHDGTNLKVTEETFIQLSASTTVQEIMGKIAVIIRPGDDERWAYLDPYSGVYSEKNLSTSKLSPYGLTKSLPTVTTTYSDWWKRVLMISDWGMDSWDSWHRRFGEDDYYYYATTATNYDKIAKNNRISKFKYEDVIIGDSVVPDTLKSEYFYLHDLSNNHKAYVQDMTRVFDVAVYVEKLEFKYAKTGTFGTLSQGTGTATVNWPESLGEKKKAIDGLFVQSVATKGGITSDDIYINNLSGYFPDEYHEYYTQKNSIIRSYDEGGKVSFFPVYDAKNFKNSGKGGNYKACADILTPYVYNILSGSSDLSISSGTKLAEGPWGIVMMDYIGTATKSVDLVTLIMMNNFKFPLAQKSTPKSAPEVKISNEMLNPEAPLLDWK